MGKKFLKIGVTGNIGSGKSTFCNYLVSKGFKVLKADEIAKDILNNEEKVKKEIIKKFGEETFADNKLNKKYLADKIFSDPQKVQQINFIIHPKVFDKLEEQFSLIKSNEKFVFVEAALIYEAGMEDFFDYVALITSELEKRYKRKEKNDNYTFEEFNSREQNQIKEEEKSKRADFEFKNNGTLKELKQKADLLLTILNGISG